MSDSVTMTRRSLRHIVCYPSMTLMLVGMPIILLLLFVYAAAEPMHRGGTARLTRVAPGAPGKGMGNGVLRLSARSTHPRMSHRARNALEIPI